MLWRLLLLLTIVPLVELYLLLKIAEHTSALFTFALVVVTGVVGAMLARWQGLGTLRRARAELAAGGLPATALFDGMLILLAGVLLVTPGVLTDVCGLLLLVPPVRRVAGACLWRRMEFRYFGPGGAGAWQRTEPVWREEHVPHDKVIDSRVIDAPPPEQGP